MKVLGVNYMNFKKDTSSINDLITAYEKQSLLISDYIDDQLIQTEQLINIESKIAEINEERLAIEKRNEAYGEIIDKILILGDKREKVFLLNFANIGELYDHIVFFEKFILASEKVPRRFLNDACMQIMRELKTYVDLNKKIIGSDNSKILSEFSEIREKYKNFNFDEYQDQILKNIDVLNKKVNWDMHLIEMKKNIFIKKTIKKLDFFTKKIVVFLWVCLATFVFFHKNSVMIFKILAGFYLLKLFVKVILRLIDNVHINKTISKISNENVISGEVLVNLFLSTADFNFHFLDPESLDKYSAKLKGYQNDSLNYWLLELEKFNNLKRKIFDASKIRKEPLPADYELHVIESVDNLKKYKDS